MSETKTRQTGKGVHRPLSPRDFDRRIHDMEAAIALVKQEVAQTIFKEECLRKGLIMKFNKALAAERKKYARLADQYNRLKKKYEAACRRHEER